MVVRLPTYIDSSLLRYYSLDEEGRKTVTRILWQLAESHPQITFAPTLYPIIAIFLHKHDQDFTYQTICQLLQRNQKAVSEKQFKSILVPTTRLEHVRDIIVLIKLCTRIGLFSSSKVNLESPSFDTPFCDWYKWIFVALPLSYCTRIVDLWLEEGQKFMFRITLAILSRYKKTCSSPLLLNSEKIFEFCSKLELLLEPKGGIEKLIKEAKSMKRISSVKIAKVSRKAQIKANLIIGSIMRRDNEAIKLIYNSGQSANYIKQPRDNMLNDIIICNRIAPRNFKSSIVDDYELLDDLWQYIPERAAVKSVEVVFNSNVDGTSLQTFFSRVDPYEDTIIIIRTTKNEVFGSYCSTSWATRKQQAQSAANKSCYFGNGETFLFTLQPKLSVFLWVGKSDSENNPNHNNNNQLASRNIHNTPPSTIDAGLTTTNNNNNNNNSNKNNNINDMNTKAVNTNDPDKSTANTLTPSREIQVGPRHRDSVTDVISSQLFMSATSQELIIGSGNGSFGLWLDADLTRGKTDHCRTFNNTPLCADRDFTCKDVEVLALS